RIEHHAVAGPGVRAAGDFHHHDAADDEQSGDDAAFGQTAAQDRPETQDQPYRGGRQGRDVFEQRPGHHSGVESGFAATEGGGSGIERGGEGRRRGGLPDYDQRAGRAAAVGHHQGRPRHRNRRQPLNRQGRALYRGQPPVES